MNYCKIALCLLTVCVGGCSTIDRVDRRTTTMNLNISESENKGILLNLARASLQEPLSFSALANYTGHQTIGGTVGLPNLGFAGNPLQLNSLQTTGSSASASASNDFSYVANDDNATYAALLQPLDPTTIGYFIKQEYPRELLLFLVVSKIRVTHGGRLLHEYVNNGTTIEEVNRLHAEHKSTPFEEFGTELQSLIDSGLTAQIDVSTNSRSKLCFDRLIAPVYPDSSEVKRGVFKPTCAEAKVFNASPPKKSEKDQKKPSVEAPQAPFSDSYRFRDVSGKADVEIFFRSPFGVYRYLGLLIAKETSLQVVRDPDSAEREAIVRIVADDQNCFVVETYRDRVYCVPNSATTTKRVFALLHDLVKLYTFPSPAPFTLSARLVPGGG